MTTYRAFESACPHCRYRWSSMTGGSSNSFGSYRQADISQEQAKTKLRSALSTMREYPETPYRCPSCKSFDVEYREHPHWSSAKTLDPDIDPLNDGRRIRPRAREISGYFYRFFAALNRYWGERIDLDQMLREEKTRELNALLDTITNQFQQISEFDQEDSSPKVLEVEKLIQRLGIDAIEIDENLNDSS